MVRTKQTSLRSRVKYSHAKKQRSRPLFPRKCKRMVPKCAICLELIDREEMKLDCGHEFHYICVLNQLQNKWPGARMTFEYLGCALCREEIKLPPSKKEHWEGDLIRWKRDSIQENIEQGRRFRQQAFDACIARAKEDNTIEGIAKMSRREAQAVVERKMAAYLCGNCNVVFCGGKAECTANTSEEAPAEHKIVLCPGCAWKKATGGGSRCTKHGASCAIFKCDSCCSIATYDCSGTHYCARCHSGYWGAHKHERKPNCKGVKKHCPLSVKHPPNVGRWGFVLGCTKCMGVHDHCNMAAVSSSTTASF